MIRHATLAFLLASLGATASAGNTNTPPDALIDTGFPASSTPAGWRRSYPTPAGVEDDTTVAAARAPDGGYVIAGATSGGQVGERIFLTKLRPDGAFDTAFGGNAGVGRVVKDAYLTNVADMIIDSQGRIVVVGSTPGALGQKDFAVVRFLSNGAIDTSFAGDGGIAIAFDRDAANNRVSDIGLGVAALPDGSLFVAGVVNARPDDQAINLLGIAKLTATGAPDTTFSSDGGRNTYCVTSPCKYVSSMARIVYDAARNRLVFGGSYVQAVYNADWYIGELSLPSGAPQAQTFSMDFGGASTNQNAYMTTLTVQRDGKVVAAGIADTQGTSQAVLLRTLSTTSILDTGFGEAATPGRRRLTTNMLEYDQVVEDSLGRLLLVGQSKLAQRGAVQRLTSKGGLDTDFNFFTGPSLYFAPTSPSPAYDTAFRAGFLDDAGRLVLAGKATNGSASEEDYDQVVTRLQTDLIYAGGFQ